MSKSHPLYREDLKDEYLFCRGGYNHSWDDYNPERKEKPKHKGNIFKYLRCTRCGTTRHTEMNSDGTWADKHIYKYPEFYRIDEKVSASQLRVEWELRRKRKSRKR